MKSTDNDVDGDTNDGFCDNSSYNDIQQQQRKNPRKEVQRRTHVMQEHGKQPKKLFTWIKWMFFFASLKAGKKNNFKQYWFRCEITIESWFSWNVDVEDIDFVHFLLNFFYCRRCCRETGE